MAFDGNTFRPWYLDQARQLLTALSAGRLHHALLISGAKGSGSGLFGSQLAQTLLCEQAGENIVSAPGCGQCKSCALNAAGTHPDLIHLTPLEDKTTIAIQSVRIAKEQLLQTAQIAKNKICLINPADALTENASNALLKLLEEPPENCFFLMPTNAAYLMLPTIRSRSLKVALVPPSRDHLREALATQFVLTDIDRAIAIYRGFPEPVLQALQEGNADAVFERQIEAFVSGRESATKLAGSVDKLQSPAFLDALYHFVVCTLARKHSGTENEHGTQAFDALGESTLLAMIQRIISARRDLRFNPSVNLHLEALLKELLKIGREMG